MQQGHLDSDANFATLCLDLENLPDAFCELKLSKENHHQFSHDSDL